MSTPRYAVGIDLGTTNCVLAYVDLRERESRSRVLQVPQMNSLDTVASGALLPSFFYFATDTEAAGHALDPFGAGAPGESTGFVVGALAREQMNALPGRVIHSAKSWLAHSGIDREARILPFGSEEVPPDLQLSPVEASAAYLDYLKQAWDHAFARADPEAAFERQRVVVTVPASFDEGAQALTREAASLAGYPASMRLLEEPQAAFYAWIEAAAAQREPGARFLELLPRLAEQEQTVLVVDVGGGTSDFSLFRVAPVRSPRELPQIERIAASDHLLLGGDNIDLALARLLERELLGEGRQLSRRQWAHLVPQARLLKERILEDEGEPEEVFHVSIPGEGGGLFASALSAQITRSAVRSLVLDGFFPLSGADEMPRTRQIGLREIGLPYAADTAVSRHLAGFLRGRPVDAVLFAGGSLRPRFLQERLLDLIGGWQGRRPAQLALADMSLAIAEGAARFAALLVSGAGRIRGGYARSVYLELRSEEPGRAPELVCVLPQGFEEGGVQTLAAPAFGLLVNRPVRFTAYTSNRRPEDRPGDLVPIGEGFHPLPPLHATLALDAEAFSARKSAQGSVQVQIEAELTELGVLQLALVNREWRKRWRLDFNLRQPAAEAAPADAPAGARPAGPGVSPEALEAAARRIEFFYGKKQAASPKDNVKTLARDLEKILGQERSRWSAALLRALWPALYPGMTRRVRSIAHENAWLYLAGFLLRPGYGSDLDPWRMTQLWECHALGLAHRKEKSAQSNWWMMWRRTAGGLSAQQQQALYHDAMPELRRSGAEFVEGTRLLASLERLPQANRIELAEFLVDQVARGRAANQQHVFWALGRLLGRVPLYTVPDTVIPPAAVEGWFARLAPLDWRKLGLQPLAGVFSAACRMTGARALDVQDAVRGRVLETLKRNGAREEQLRIVRERCEISAADRDVLFGEELPAGLSLAAEQDEA